MKHITTTVIWQELNISKQSHRIVLRCLLKKLEQYCIDKLGQNHVIPQYDYFFPMGELFLNQTYHKI